MSCATTPSVRFILVSETTFYISHFVLFSISLHVYQIFKNALSFNEVSCTPRCKHFESKNEYRYFAVSHNKNNVQFPRCDVLFPNSPIGPFSFSRDNHRGFTREGGGRFIARDESDIAVARG